MWMTRTSIKHPVFATMVMVGLMVLGLFSYRSLGVESMPNIEIPAVWIETQYPGASPEQVENDVTRPLEEAANTVGGIKALRSNSWEGRSGISVEFQLTVDMDRAVQDLRDRIGTVRGGFPREVKEPVVYRQEGENAQPVLLVLADLIGPQPARPVDADRAGDRQAHPVGGRGRPGAHQRQAGAPDPGRHPSGAAAQPERRHRRSHDRDQRHQRQPAGRPHHRAASAKTWCASKAR